MPNPYHDSNGKFCSKDEMLSAINKLANEGKVEEFIALKSSYEKIISQKSTLASDYTNSIKHKNGEEHWVNGQQHHENGPALVNYLTGEEQFWLNGQKFNNETEYAEKLKEVNPDSGYVVLEADEGDLSFQDLVDRNQGDFASYIKVGYRTGAIKPGTNLSNVYLAILEDMHNQAYLHGDAGQYDT